MRVGVDGSRVSWVQAWRASGIEGLGLYKQNPNPCDELPLECLKAVASELLPQAEASSAVVRPPSYPGDAPDNSKETCAHSSYFSSTIALKFLALR